MVRRSTTDRDRDRKRIAATRSACAICGDAIDYTLDYPHPRAFVVDHIVALDNGGTDTLDNKQPAHNECNRAKGTRHHAPIVRRSGSLG